MEINHIYIKDQAFFQDISLNWNYKYISQNVFSFKWIILMSTLELLIVVFWTYVFL